MYEVWTIRENGELGELLCISTRIGCERYIKQAIKKGAKAENLAIIKA